MTLPIQFIFTSHGTKPPTASALPPRWGRFGRAFLCPELPAVPDRLQRATARKPCVAGLLRVRRQGTQGSLQRAPKLRTVEHQMKTQHHFEIESEDARREVAQIRTMIVDLDRVARFLASDIVIEEERSGVADRSDPAYPILARTLAARRDNLKVTIATLEQRVEEILAALPGAIAA